MINKIYLFLVLLTGCASVLAQTIEGSVFSHKTNLPLEGVTIYFDGTTIGTTTNSEGYFKLELSELIATNLIISYLGFKEQVFASPFRVPKKIMLQEEITSLDEVVIAPDDWSREKKLNIFRREFLGKDVEAQHCKILNEDDLRLRYSPRDNVLYASSKNPIVIINKYLGYKITYNLMDFEVVYNKSINGFNLIQKMFYFGTSRFEELHKKPRKKHLKNRLKAYKGSMQHFMRALASRQLEENDFVVFARNEKSNSNMHFKVNPYENFVPTKLKNGTTDITQSREKLVIQYNGHKQSFILIEEEDKSFNIDTYGCHSPIDKLNFGGDFGFKRLSTLLPLNFYPD